MKAAKTATEQTNNLLLQARQYDAQLKTIEQRKDKAMASVAEGGKLDLESFNRLDTERRAIVGVIDAIDAKIIELAPEVESERLAQLDAETRDVREAEIAFSYSKIELAKKVDNKITELCAALKELCKGGRFAHTTNCIALKRRQIRDLETDGHHLTHVAQLTRFEVHAADASLDMLQKLLAVLPANVASCVSFIGQPSGSFEFAAEQTAAQLAMQLGAVAFPVPSKEAQDRDRLPGFRVL